MPKKKKTLALAKIDPRVGIMTDYVREHPDIMFHEDAHIFENLNKNQQNYLVALNKWGNQKEAKEKVGITSTQTLSMWRYLNKDFKRMEEMVKTQGGIVGRHMLENLQFAAAMTVRELLDAPSDTIKVAAAKTILQAARPLPPASQTLIVNMPSGWAASEINSAVKEDLVDGEVSVVQ